MPGQHAKGIPAIAAQRMVGDNSAPQPAAIAAF